jgi:hypothetical protein
MGGRRNTRHRLLPPIDLGESTGDMGMLWLEVTGLVKGSAGFVKLPLSQARVPLHKGMMRDILLLGPALGRNAKGVRLPAAPTTPGEPPCTDNDDQHHDHETHTISFPVSLLATRHRVPHAGGNDFGSMLKDDRRRMLSLDDTRTQTGGVS